MTTTVMLNADQEEIRGVARSFLADRFPSEKVRELMATPTGFEESSWKEIAELGWTGISLSEDRGGAGYGGVERCILMEEMGAALFPDPYLSSAVLAADAVALAGEGAAADEVLESIVAGTRATLVAAGDLCGGEEIAGDVTASAAGDSAELSGSGGLVLDGHTAEILIVAAAVAGGVGLFAVEPDASGVERNPAPTIDETRKTAIVEFENASARRLDDPGGDATEAIRSALDGARVALAAEMVGGARRAIEMTVAYMHEREQFGGPIGRFQALKHRLADLHVRIDAAREGVYSAADAIAEGEADQIPMAASAAKYAASTGYTLTTAEAVQLHGGIGFTEEHDIGLYYKRALVSAEALGSPANQLERVAVGLDV